MRELIKVAVLSSAVLAIPLSLMLAGHRTPATKSVDSVQASPVAGATPVAIKPVAKPAHHPLQAVMETLGMASWYGGARDGHRTASGEMFDKSDLTACHKTLPFGTMVRVVDVSSGRSVVVRINDRGVLSPGRIIDLSSRAADDLGMLRAGVARVRLEVLHGVQRKDGPAAMKRF